MFRVIIIDDELPAIDELRFNIEKNKNFSIIGEYTDPKEGLMNIIQHKPDVVFLDIHMPEIKGDTIAEMLNTMEHSPYIVFVTAYDEYAVKAFEVNAMDYILKPIEEKRFNKILKRIEDAMTKKTSSSKIPLWKGDKIVLLDLSEVLFITSNERELEIYTKQGVFYKKDTLQNFQELLTDHFFKSHRNFIINIDEIDEIIPWFNNNYVVKYKNYDHEIPVSRRNTKDFKDLLKL